MKKALIVCLALILASGPGSSGHGGGQAHQHRHRWNGRRVVSHGRRHGGNHQQACAGFKATAEASAASLENIRNLSQGDVEWGISQNEVAFWPTTDRGNTRIGPWLRCNRFSEPSFPGRRSSLPPTAPSTG